MSDKVLFSVIVPVYNRRDLVRTTIDSVLNQSYKSYELILVDDGSTDDTLQVLNEYKRENIRVFTRKNEERSAARNFGASMARGEYLTFLDSDDLLYAQHLETAAQLLSQYPKTEWFNLHYDRLDILTGRKLAPDIPKNNFKKKLWKGNFLACQGVFVRRDIFDVQQFNPQLNLMEDWDLWLRLSSRYNCRSLVSAPTSALVLHPERSVTSPEFGSRLENKVFCFMQSIHNALGATEDYKHYARFLKSSCYSYVSLHLLLGGIRKKSFFYFMKSIVFNPAALFSRRSAAIVKRLIVKG